MESKTNHIMYATGTESPRIIPYYRPEALHASSYAAEIDGRVVRLLDGKTPSAELEHQFGAFKDFVEHTTFPCLGAKAALHANTFRVGVYGPLASHEATAGLARDLIAFLYDPLLTGDYRTFAAIFAPDMFDEAAFEQALWTQLGMLARVDRHVDRWDPTVSENPEDPNFSFSFGGTALFVVGLHRNASRVARRFARPMLVFNPHRQFEAIRERGKWERFITAIRDRDIALQGSPNPNLADYGTRSEARQYSGRAVEDAWMCPFRP
jgi:hypothetical protein